MKGVGMGKNTFEENLENLDKIIESLEW